MSHTLDLLSTVEHGTVAGYQAGCHGSLRSCGAVVSCAEVYRRYQGDWGFRKRVKAGESPADIVAEELAEADAIRARDKAANRKAKAEGGKTNDARLARRRSRSTLPVNSMSIVARISDDVRRLVAEGKTAKEIAGILGVSNMAVTRARQAMGLPSSRMIVDRDEVARLHGEGLSDQRIAVILGVSNSTIGYIRRDALSLPRNHGVKAQPGTARADRAQRLTDLHAAGKNDAEIGEALNMSRGAVSQARARLKLPINRQATRKPTTAPGRPEQARPHDEPQDTRKAVIRAHGTPQGYLDGCRGSGCPETPSCTDAKLAQARAERRATQEQL